MQMPDFEWTTRLSFTESRGYSDPGDDRVDEDSCTLSLLQLEESDEFGDGNNLTQGYDPYNSAA